MQIPCVYIPGPAPAVSVANNTLWAVVLWCLYIMVGYKMVHFTTVHDKTARYTKEHYQTVQRYLTV
jgi:hypothetical protein